MQKPPEPPYKEAYGPYLYLLVLLPCLIYTVFYTARAVKLDYTPVPVWDAWRGVQYLDQLLKFDLGHFWLQHNDHRIVFPEMIYALDYIFLHGVLLLPIACNIACQMAQLALLWWLLLQMKDMPLAFRLTLGVCCSLFMTSAMQVQGFLGVFELQWYLSQLAVALAFVFLSRSQRTGNWTGVAMSIVGCVIATYSTGSGMLVWPVLVVMAALLRLPKARIVTLATAGTLSIAGYFVGYSFDHTRAAIFRAHPFYAIWFTGVFLGAPLSYMNVTIGGVAGWGTFLLVALAAAIAIRQRRPSDRVFVVTAGVCLYIAWSAFTIAYGRMHPPDPAMAGALAARYISTPLAYWANLCVLIGWLVLKLPRGRRVALHLSSASLALAVLVAVMLRQSSHERAFELQAAHAHESGVALVAGIEDVGLMDALGPHPQLELSVVGNIRQRRLSMFTSGHQDWIGQRLNGVFAPGPATQCSGAVEELSPVTGGYRVAGWAWDRAADRPPKDIVLANAAGVIVGFGETRHGGYPHNDPTRRPPSDWDWVAFGRSAGLSGTIQAYAIVHGGVMACALGPPLAAPGTQLLAAKQVGAAIHISAWKADPAWTRNGFHPSVGTLAGENLYGSFSGNDANQGVLTSAPFTVSGHTCIAVPFAHGPSVGGQSLRLVEPGSGKVVQSMQLSDTPGIWQFWAVDIKGVDSLSIVAEDRGSQWGQWLAVGEPHWCLQ